MEAALRTLSTAMLVALVLVLARAAGPRAAGIAAAMPWVSAPTLAWLVLDQGPVFAGRAAAGAVVAIGALSLFVLGYAALSAGRPGRALAGGLCLAALATLPLAVLAAHPPLSLSAAAAAWLCAARALSRRPAASGAAPSPCPLGVAALAAGSGSVLLAGLAPSLGAQTVGIAAAMPVVGAPVLLGLHRQAGVSAGLHFLRGYLDGLCINLGLNALVLWLTLGRA